KTNEPAWVVHVAQRIAELKGCGVDEVARKTTANFERFTTASLAS
ncbi:MAG: TatD related DNase, partial [Pseudomonadota bacterium]